MRLSRAARTGFRFAVAVSLLLLAASGIRWFVAYDHPARPLLDLLNLGAENNIGAWWSGMLLLLSSLHAYDGAHASRLSRPGSRWAWLVISGLLLFLSADETGSFHEKLSHYLTGEPWIPLGVLGLVLGTAAIAALRELWVSGDRSSALWIFVGFSLLGSILLQEYLEHNLEWTGPMARALRLTVEEGTELAGILLILRVTMRNTAGPSADSTRPAGGVFAALRWKGWPLVIVGVLLSGILAVVSTELVADFPRQGRVANWFAAAAYLCTALVVLRPAIGGSPLRVGDRKLSLAGAALCVLASASAVAIDPLYMVEIGPFWFNVRLTVLPLAVGLFAVIRLPVRRSPTATAMLLLVSAITGMIAIAFSLWLLGVFLLTQLLALAVLVSETAAPAATAPYSPTP